MSVELRELYRSPNGDVWYLAQEPISQRVFVRHHANEPSGGLITDIELAEFLSREGHSPEGQALVRLIGSLAAANANN